MFDNDDDLETFKNLFTYVKRLHAIANEHNPEMDERMEYDDSE